jgi:catechol 2,3-dioxygenase-like lactoylglutathione lyase family enzyme
LFKIAKRDFRFHCPIPIFKNGDNAMFFRIMLALPLALALSVLGTSARTEQVSPASGAIPARQGPQAHFHHLHLNTMDPQAAIDFYTSKFECEKARFAGTMEGVWAQKSWLLFTKVNQAPAWELTSAIWHFGWGAEDMKATYEKHLAMNTKFFTPLTDISNIANPNAPAGSFYYAYIESPDRALIEINTANHHRFGHLHLFSADPVAAGEWYMKYLGAQRRSTRPPSREPRFYRGIQIGPSMSLMLDNVNIIIYPVEYPKQAYAEHWKGRTELQSTRGRVVDHVGFSFDNLAEALETMRKDGVKVTELPRFIPGSKVKSAFIEGPDKIRIELIEGRPGSE